MKNKRWLCYQMIIASIEYIGGQNNTKMETLIRNIGAKTKEEAIGKFILQTADIKAVQRLDPICFELDTLLKID